MASNFFRGFGITNQSTPARQTNKNRPNEQDQKRKHVSSPESTTNKCAKCNNELGEEKISCHWCSLSFCIRCAGMTRNAYELLASGALEDFSYTCKSCKNTRPTLMNIDRKLTKVTVEQEKRIVALEDRMEKINVETKETVREEFTQMKQQMESELDDKINTMIEKKTQELEDRRRRELNIVVFYLSEGKSTDNQENKGYDEGRVSELAAELGIDSLEIETSYRLGKKARGKTRVLKVILKNRRQRKRLLESAREIKDKTSEEYRNVIVAKDLTVEQREQRKEKLRSRKDRERVPPQEDQEENQMDLTVCAQKAPDQTIELTQEVLDPFLSETIIDQHGQRALEDIGEKTIIGGMSQTENIAQTDKRNNQCDQ